MARAFIFSCSVAVVTLGCGDSGGRSSDSDSATNVTGVTGASAVTVTTGDEQPTEGSASGTTSDDAGSASMASDVTTDDVSGTTSDLSLSDTDTTGTASASATDSDSASDSTTDSESESNSESDSNSDSDSDDTTTGEMLCQQQIDIVFSMDVSTSMIGLLQKLEDEILTVDAKLKTLDILPSINYGLVVFVDDTLIINNGAPYADVNTLKQDFNTWWKFTQSNSQVNGMGFNGDWPENTLDALHNAATNFQWRPVENTLRMVIHCTDDTFGNKGAVQSGITVQHTYEETVQALQDRQIRVFAFGDNDMTGGPGNNQDVSMGFFTPYQGMTPIPEATDGGAFNINLVLQNQLSLNAAINDSVEQSLCQQYIPQ